MKNIFTNIPAFKYLLFFLSGFLFSLEINLDIMYILTFGLFYLMLLFISLKYNKFRNNYFLAIFISGIILGHSYQSDQIYYPNKIIPDFPGVFKGRVESIVREDNKSIRCFINGNLASKVIGNQSNTRIFSTIFKNSTFSLNEGDSLIANIKIKVPQTAQFREDFNERNYARSNDANWFGYSSTNKIAIISRAGWLNRTISNIRKEINFRVNLLFSIDNSGIINALITGNKTGIDNEITQDFSLSGTAHVLAVSGLHIGIISSIIVIFLAFIPNRWLKYLIFAIFLITYITITGLQASALRAGVLSLIIYFLYLMERKINLLNTLSFGVILIVLFQPILIFSPGFQMSVAAMLSIAIFYPMTISFVNKLIKYENTVIMFFKKSVSVSISVNILVSPIVAYYFGYYSIISPIANILIIPVISIATILAVVTLSISYISIGLSIYFSNTTNFLIDISKFLAKIFSEMQFAFVTNDTIVFITIIISCLFIYIILSNNYKTAILRLSLCFVILFLVGALNFSFLNNKIEIYPRPNTISLFIPTSNHEKIIMILDRKPHQYPILDNSLYKHIKKIDTKYILMINGNNGIRISDELIKGKSINIKLLSINTINKILKLIKLDNNIYQFIKLNK